MFDFFQKRPFALHVTDKLIQLMKVSGSLENPRVDVFIEKPLPTGVIVAGEIMKKDELRDKILQLMEEAKIKNNADVVLTFDEAACYENTFFYNGSIDEEAVVGFLYKKIGMMMPVASDRLKYDYIVYGLGDMKIIFMVASKSALVNAYRDFLKKECNLNPIAFEPEILSLMRNISFPSNLNKGYLFILAHNNAINWYLMEKGLIFDSNSAKLQNLPDALGDLQKSIKFFKDKTNQEVEKILVTGSDLNQLEALKQLKIEMVNYNEYFIKPLTDDQKSIGLNFFIVGGAALKKIKGLARKFEINLFKN